MTNFRVRKLLLDRNDKNLEKENITQQQKLENERTFAAIILYRGYLLVGEYLRICVQQKISWARCVHT